MRSKEPIQRGPQCEVPAYLSQSSGMPAVTRAPSSRVVKALFYFCCCCCDKHRHQKQYRKGLRSHSPSLRMPQSRQERNSKQGLEVETKERYSFFPGLFAPAHDLPAFLHTVVWALLHQSAIKTGPTDVHRASLLEAIPYLRFPLPG